MRLLASGPSRIAAPALALAFALGLSALAGCQPRREPEIASSSGESNYAASYPTDLTAQMAAFNDHQQEGKKLTSGFSAFDGQLSGANKAQVLSVIERADEAGRGAAYAERAQSLEQVDAFFDSEKDEINKRVAGSAAFVAKQKGCTNVDIYGTVAHSLREAVDKQIEKRMRERNDAQEVIERYRVSLGKQNAAALEKQADDISRASYLVYIDLVDRKVRVARMVDEADKVRRTADAFIEREKAFQAEPGRTDPEKKSSDERVAAMQRSRAAMDASVTQAKSALPDMDRQIRGSQQDYQSSLETLKAKWRK